jgi:hypothetical protein
VKSFVVVERVRILEDFDYRSHLCPHDQPWLRISGIGLKIAREGDPISRDGDDADTTRLSETKWRQIQDA